jgi:hypothetical protein
MSPRHDLAFRDPPLERALEDLLASLEARYQKSLTEDGSAGPTVRYRVDVRPDLDLRLGIELLGDQMDVVFDDCRIRVEEAAHMPRLRRNAGSRDEWRTECVALAREILTSDLRVETRWLRGRLLGGFLYRRTGAGWERLGGGGSILLALGRRRVSEYHSWLPSRGSTGSRPDSSV